VVDLDINELSDRAGVTPRTVHFYIQQGLLPPAGSPGPGARYRAGHVVRIKLIRLLQKQHLPLAEIGRRIRGLSDAAVEALLAETKERRPERGTSALDYIRHVLADSNIPDGAPLAPRQRSTVAATAQAAFAESGAAPARSQWERYALTDGMELHIRRPLSRVEQKQFEKVMAAAKAILAETEGEK
jgi:DNA-binding transcriptional MerR regulator